ncbi:MAG: ABC transporter substrate-binding protein, partial [Bacteroidia bacterium]|nr:ABC transporter substrate-binding protein [Bacteroidia bacterium]
GRDMLSTLPEHAKLAPEVGYMRSLNDEGILSLKPTHLIATSEAGPEAVLQKIADAGVRLVRTPRLISRDSTVKAIEIVARALNKADSGRKLIANLLAKTDSAARIAASRTDKPRVLYFNTRGDATSLFAHGKQTAADFYITGAGAVNVADFDNVKPLSEEALLAADPDVLLFDQDTFERLGGLEGLSASGLFSKLRAVREKRIVVAPTAHFFGVGPHAGELLLNFQRAFRP